MNSGLESFGRCTSRPLASRFLWAAIALSFLLATAILHAATKTWDGSTDGNWSLKGNWTDNLQPQAGDTLVFPASGVTHFTCTNNFDPPRAFRSITFGGSNYVIFGTNLALTNGITSQNTAGTNTINCDLQLSANQTYACLGANAELDFNGDIALGANSLTVTNPGDIFISGAISGTGGVTKNGVGTLRYKGLSSNPYTGITRVNEGVLELGKLATLASVSGDLIVGDGIGGAGADIVRLLTRDQIGNSVSVTVTNSGVLDLNGHNETIGPLTISRGTVQSGAGVLTLNGDVTATGSTSVNDPALITGNLALGNVTRTFNVAAGVFSLHNCQGCPGDLKIDAAISGAGGIMKTGNGELSLTAANTYSGLTTVAAGVLIADNDNALGATTAGTIVSNGATLAVLEHSHVGAEALTLNGSGTVGQGSPLGALHSPVTGGSNSWAGNITLASDSTVGVDNGTFLNLSGVISGSGDLTKTNGTGVLIFSGSSANTYTGSTIVQEGELRLQKTAINGAIVGPLIIGDNVGGAQADVVRFFGNSQIADGVPITVNASGLLDLNGFSDLIGPLTLNAGTVDSGTGTLGLNGDVAVNSPARIFGNLGLGSVTRTFNVAASEALGIAAGISGTGGITKTGAGLMSLESPNTYGGVTTVQAGTLFVDDSLGLGATSAGTIVSSGAVLALQRGSHVGAEPLTLNGVGTSSFGALHSQGGSNSWAGLITNASDTTISVRTNSFLNLSGPMTGPGGFAKLNDGVLIFSGPSANTYAGGSLVNGGILLLDKSVANGAIPGELTIGGATNATQATTVVRLAQGDQIADRAVHILETGLLDLNGFNESIGAVDGSGQMDLGASGVSTLRVGVDNGSSTFDGIIRGTGATNALFKVGTGTWTLIGSNTYLAPTTVSAGTLMVNGSQPQSQITVTNSSSALMGTGVVGNLLIESTLSPGTSPGILTCSNVAFGSQGQLFVELNGPLAGSGFDQLNVRGTNQLGGAALHVSVAPGFAPFDGEEFVILNNDGADPIAGTFVNLPNGSLVTSANGRQFRIRYFDAFNNDVVITFTNTFLHVAEAAVSGGNNNGALDFNECGLLNVVLTNVFGGAVSGVSATLKSRTANVAVTQPFSAYPNMAVGARGTNSTPFQVSLAPGFPCGSTVDLELVVQTSTNGVFRILLHLPSGVAGAPVRFDNNTTTIIPDNGSVDVPIAVSGVNSVKNVTVSLYITHSVDADLDISLTGPDGTTVDLSSGNGGTGDDYGIDCVDASRTTFTDSAVNPITAGSAPFVGQFRPEQPLSAFNDKSDTAVNGTWRLHIADHTPGAAGSLRCWSLFISPTVCSSGGGRCKSCPDRTIFGSIRAGSLSQPNRLLASGSASACGALKSCPGPANSGSVLFDSYTFINGESNACINVTLLAGCPLFSAAYLNSYKPSDVCQNYLADIGANPAATNYSFTVDANATFVIVVNALLPFTECDYSLTVSGGSCRPHPAFSNISLAGTNVVLSGTSDKFGFQLDGPRNGPFLLLSSTNVALPLAQWTPLLLDNFDANGNFNISNAIDPAQPQRFFVLDVPPLVTLFNFDNFGNGAGSVLFNLPRFSGSTSAFLDASPNFTLVTDTFPPGLGSSKVLKIQWSFAAGTTDPWLRLTTFNTASLRNPAIDFHQVFLFDIYVERPIMLGLGLRETSTSAPLGADGGTSGTIEFVGVTSTTPSGRPNPTRLVPAGTWTTLQFNIPSEPVAAFTGNGILESTTGKGVLEHLNIVPEDGSGTYTIYLDNFRLTDSAP